LIYFESFNLVYEFFGGKISGVLELENAPFLSPTSMIKITSKFEEKHGQSAIAT
jgi:hypothetical protein